MEEKKLHNVILDDHRTLLDALRRKDSEEAEAIMRNHLNHARDIYFDIIDEKGTWTPNGQVSFESFDLINLYKIPDFFS